MALDADSTDRKIAGSGWYRRPASLTHGAIQHQALTDVPPPLGQTAIAAAAADFDFHLNCSLVPKRPPTLAGHASLSTAMSEPPDEKCKCADCAVPF
jgi:hypothetical protein